MYYSDYFGYTLVGNEQVKHFAALWARLSEYPRYAGFTVEPFGIRRI
jgi:hypothetical protein